jgi:membrane-bound serine protease (ClpP class)
MDYTVVFALSMLTVGQALIVAELFIPSGGRFSVLSVICIRVSIYTAHEAWFAEYPNRFWWFLGSIVGLIPATAGCALFLLSRTRLGSRVFLEAPKLEDVTPYSQESEVRKQLVGKLGKTLTLMAPGGLVVIEGQRMHAETEGQMLDPEQPIRIISIKANRVVVRPYEPKAGTNGTAAAKKTARTEEPRLADEDRQLPPPVSEPAEVPLDFEIPES